MLEEDKESCTNVSSITPEEFINSSYKFVVDPEMEDISKALLAENANKVLDWKNIVLVLCPLKGKYSCPICQDEELLAPRVSKCGHVICFPCFLQYSYYRNNFIKHRENKREG